MKFKEAQRNLIQLLHLLLPSYESSSNTNDLAFHVLGIPESAGLPHSYLLVNNTSETLVGNSVGISLATDQDILGNLAGLQKVST